MIGRIDLFDPIAFKIGRKHRIPQEIFTAQRPETILQRLLCLDPRNRRGQCRQQIERQRHFRFQNFERIVAVNADNGRQNHRLTIRCNLTDLGCQRLEILLPVKHPGNIGRTHLTRIFPNLLQIGEIDAAKAARYPIFAELLCDELRIKIQKTLHIDNANLFKRQLLQRIGRQITRHGQPGRLCLAQRGDPIMVPAAIPLHGNTGRT